MPRYYTCRWVGLDNKPCLAPTIDSQYCKDHKPRVIWPQDEPTRKPDFLPRELGPEEAP